MVEDIKYNLKRNIDINALAEGEFHTLEFDDSKVTLFFRRNYITKELKRVILYVSTNKKHNYIIISERATVKKNDKKLVVLFRSGHRQYLNKDSKLDTIKFDSHTLVLPILGAQASTLRKNKTLLEMNYRELANAVRNAKRSERYRGRARSELTKRLLAPPMTLAHTMLAIGILFYFGPVRTLWHRVHVWVALTFVAAHGVTLGAIETVARGSVVVTWFIAVILVAEFIFGTTLLFRSNLTFRKSKWRGVAQPAASAPNQ